MQFLEDVIITCEACEGKRFRPEVLKIQYRDKNIYDVLSMTVDEALEFFGVMTGFTQSFKSCTTWTRLPHLGQSTNTLSGGESQRLKLAHHIGQAGQGRDLFIFDEPTRVSTSPMLSFF